MDEPDFDWLSFDSIENLSDEADEVFRSFAAAMKCNDTEAATRFLDSYTDIASLISCQTPTTLLECGKLSEMAGALIAARARGLVVISEHDELAMLGACHANYQRLLLQHYETGAQIPRPDQIDWTAIRSYVSNDNADGPPAS